jgi:hypothetical protein
MSCKTFLLHYTVLQVNQSYYFLQNNALSYQHTISTGIIDIQVTSILQMFTFFTMTELLILILLLCLQILFMSIDTIHLPCVKSFRI